MGAFGPAVHILDTYSIHHPEFWLGDFDGILPYLGSFWRSYHCGQLAGRPRMSAFDSLRLAGQNVAVFILSGGLPSVALVGLPNQRCYALARQYPWQAFMTRNSICGMMRRALGLWATVRLLRWPNWCSWVTVVCRMFLVAP